jgi:hypothetical protein
MSDPTNAERQARHRAKRRQEQATLEAELRAEIAALKAQLAHSQHPENSPDVQEQSTVELVETAQDYITEDADSDEDEDEDADEERDALIAERDKLGTLVDELLAELDRRSKSFELLLKKTNHYIGLVETYASAIASEMFKGKLPSQREIYRKLDPWMTDEKFDELTRKQAKLDKVAKD